MLVGVDLTVLLIWTRASTLPTFRESSLACFRTVCPAKEVDAQAVADAIAAAAAHARGDGRTLRGNESSAVRKAKAGNHIGVARLRDHHKLLAKKHDPLGARSLAVTDFTERTWH